MRKHWIKFSNLKKGEKIFRIINLCLMMAFFLLCVSVGIYYSTIGDPDNRIFSCVTLGVVFLLPFFVELIVGRRFSNLMFLVYQLYAILAGMGSIFNIYKTLPYYDKFIHVLAGYAFSLVGLYVISLFDDYSKFKPWTMALFCFCFTLAISLCWELIEWFSDLFLGQTAQGAPVPGYDAPLVTDTVSDMLCNFCGGLVFAIHYLVGKYAKKSLGIKFYEKEFVFKRNVAVSTTAIAEPKNVENIEIDKEQNQDNEENSEQNLND